MNKKTILQKVKDPALFNGWYKNDTIRFFNYFFKLSKNPEKPADLRTHTIALYDPFAKRSVFSCWNQILHKYLCGLCVICNGGMTL